jgi:hypothetical protein
MDKILAVIIVFLGITFSLAGILAMGAVPKIFQTGEKVDQSLIQQHEDQARENQSNKITRETNKSINELEQRLYKFFNVSAERSERGQQERQKLLQDNQLLFRNQEAMLKGIQKILNEAVTKMTEHQLTIKKYGSENNALGRAISEELGLNVTTILNEYYTKHNMTQIYPPPPAPNTTSSTTTN